ncbi:phospho-N-acetylmuramoyl-pentapeptide-transferase [Vagococcus carniphilus]|uniref:phospho-N-acetylmuramoyl-pentapeptide- transferase n=1 Tax=Vagococcus carniphilus TaxID=218144 RepID=UPI00288FF0F7|nr:phospho-N-acetylmuramoyl-pentapeptide-transferase [Vagococcus carniphilus]MDT2813862.1 phospho-N-acetylmuramoyl-pentapeptide-transferase [Vagococcus carniphilus]MDT2850018.1 phospho-N-acetylmuramoyl-pentapeptide-transferase [Vagococcus carniphilus]MDT2865539.1 phospho-N-acetylmuramoyl-pentapeptide-transferase [Vagococcus carniphilus]
MTLPQLLIPLSLGFAFVLMAMPQFIAFFKMKKMGQAVREEGPQAHLAKTGTPTMGGVIFLFSILLASIITGIWQKELTTSFWSILFILGLYGLLGFLDDFIKVFKKRNLGLNSKQKLIGQIIGGIILYAVMKTEGISDVLHIPFLGEVNLGIIYGVFAVFWLVGFSNAVNLTDGIDGLVSGLGSISFGTYAIIAWHQEQYDILLICIASVGALLGFLVYNKKPAKIFMGDVGSLALGGMLAAISILLHQEWTLLLIGLVYVVETASVILQVGSFKLTGKRIFKMSPIHHHFELSGWSEWKIDIVFWIVGLVMSGITLAILYL